MLWRAVGAAPSKKSFGGRNCNDSERERDDVSGGGEGEGEGKGGEDGEEESPSDCVEHILSDKGLYKSLLLRMALGRERPRKSQSSPISA